MLAHHLFYSHWSQQLYNDYYFNGIGVVNRIGMFSKLCVAIFVFVSGYGLAVTTKNNIRLKEFYLHRFKKLYLNYWYIWLIFVPIGVLGFGRSFSDAYGEYALLKTLLDVLGLLKVFGFDGYNPTWWFYSCIIILYLIYPFLNKYLFRTPFFFISLALTIVIVGFLPGINVISGYLLSFIMGIFMSKIPLSWLEETKTWHIVISIACLSAWRFTNSSPKHIVDATLCACFAMMVYKVSIWKWLRRFLETMGRHSMNMFLIHTFFFYYWFTEYIYITRNPLIIFLSLLSVSFFTSVLIEKTKSLIGFYKIA